MRALPCSLIAAALLLAMANPPALAGPATPGPRAAESAADKARRLQWWTDARFGLFLHWGLYAVPAGEWKGSTNHAEWFMDSTGIPLADYERYAKRFDPKRYDPDAWMRAARDAGMRYVIVTSKHHEGFSMWDSKATGYDIVERTPYGKDVLKPLAQAARRHGLHFGTYYSIMDWHHPSQRRQADGHYNPTKIDPTQKAEYVRQMKAQLKELVLEVGTEVLWFDGEWVDWWTLEDGRDMVAYLRQLKPDIIINNRVANTRGGMAGISPEGAPGDFGTPEQEIPAAGLGPGQYWESCMTMNGYWGYNRFDRNWKSDTMLVRNLIDIASKGGNYLLNIGPTAEGELPAESLQRLHGIGRWMRANGESIHGSSAGGLVQAPAWGRVTRKPGRVYLHVFDWPADGKLAVALGEKVSGAHLLAAPSQALPLLTTTGGVEIAVPATAPDPVASVVVLDVEQTTAEGARTE